MNINLKIAEELKVESWKVDAAVALLKEGATVPFISRYRKEATGALTDTDLRQLEERLGYLEELEARKQTVLASIEEQGKLTEALRASITEADNKARVEDLYLPFKPKRRTKAQIAKEAGLEPLALLLLEDPNQDPAAVALQYLNPEKEIQTGEQALEGARHILSELIVENADLINVLREYVWAHGKLQSTVQKDKEEAGAKFSDYFDYSESIKQVPSHRALAVFRGQKEEFLKVSIELDEDNTLGAYHLVAQAYRIANQGRKADLWLNQLVDWTWKVKLKFKIDLDLYTRLREDAESMAIKVFNDNLKNLLMAAPAGNHVVLGLDPGLRTGVKVVVVDGTGKLLFFTTIFPHVPRKAWDESLGILVAISKQFNVKLVSIGNGTASRETDQLVAEMMKKHPELGLSKIVVSEAGASVYSASELAAKEFPELDVTYRGAVSIARRLQDPLAELVKIDPKSIGVGQYQHDVNQVKLGRGLKGVLEDCVNAVGADVNTASVPLLRSIAGLNETIANNLIEYREKNGPFKNRQEIKKVPRLGDKTYQQAIGFLRIIGGENPLDASAVHPESYPLVEQMMQKSNRTIESFVGNLEAINTLKPEDYVTAEYGIPTVVDVLNELKKPGRDPRPEFKMAKFVDGVCELKDLKGGMILEGVVTNVTNFGAFVDIGVHQDGLVHISQLSNDFVTDPHKVVKVGQIVTVKVIEVDMARKRIQLSMNLSTDHQSNTKAQNAKPASNASHRDRHHKERTVNTLSNQSDFGSALANALRK